MALKDSLCDPPVVATLGRLTERSELRGSACGHLTFRLGRKTDDGISLQKAVSTRSKVSLRLREANAPDRGFLGFVHGLRSRAWTLTSQPKRSFNAVSAWSPSTSPRIRSGATESSRVVLVTLYDVEHDQERRTSRERAHSGRPNYRDRIAMKAKATAVMMASSVRSL